MLGPWINSAALLAGGSLGAMLSRRVPKRVRDALPLSCGIISAAVGAVMMNKVHTIPAVSLALLYELSVQVAKVHDRRARRQEERRELSEDGWELHLAVNLLGPYFASSWLAASTEGITP